MEPDALKNAQKVVSGIIDAKDPFEKASVILKVIPVECFDEAFRFFSPVAQKALLEALERKVNINSVETKLVVEEFIKSNDLNRFLKTTTLRSEEILAAFQKYAVKHPRKISEMIELTWLGKRT